MRAFLARWLGTGRARPALPSRGYDRTDGADLRSVTVLPLDRELQAAVDAFRRGTPAECDETRGRIDEDGLETLLLFARRCAVLGLRQPDASWVVDGLTALAMVDESRIDAEDAASTVGLLSHALATSGADRADIVERVAALASPGMAAILERARVGGPLSDWGYAEIATPDGPTLIAAGRGRYEPALDLAGLAVRLAWRLEGGRYRAVPEIAAEVPEVWFGRGQRQAEALLARARGGIAVRGELRAGYVDEPSSQMLLVWVVEMPTADDATALLACVDQTRRRPPRFTVGVPAGRLFALFVAGSGVTGVEAFESATSLRALAEEVRPLLDEVSRSGE